MAIEGFEDLEFQAFHETELPRLLAEGRGVVAGTAAARFGSLAFRLPSGEAYTYRPSVDGIQIVAGDEDADTVIEVGQDAWEGLVHDYESAPGLLYGGRVSCPRGKAIKMVAWEPAIRAMYTGRPLFDPALDILLDRHGDPLDVEQTFTLHDDRDDMAHFLRTAGYLLVRNVFSAEEISGFLDEAKSLRGEAVKGDKLSWWAKGDQGEEVLCRVTRAASRPGLATIPSDPRLLGLVSLADEELVHRSRDSSEESVSVIYKQPGMTEGLSDLPWHRDCGMGGHSVMCPILIASTFLTQSTPETGELRMLPGSWKGSTPYLDATRGNAPKGASFVANPGDVSLHYGDTMHAAPPPSRSDLDAYRVSAVTGYTRPDVRNHRGKATYNDVLHQREDGQIEHLTKVADRV